MFGYKAITPAQASATITVVDYTALSGKTITVNGTVFTEGVEWTAETSNAVTAGNIATGVSADGWYTADDGAVVTLTADETMPGDVGNSITLATNAGAALTLSGSTLSGAPSGIVGTSGDPVVLSHISINNGGAITNLNIYDGTSNSDTLILNLTCPASISKVFKFKSRIVVPNGCYIAIESADALDLPTNVAIGYKKI